MLKQPITVIKARCFMKYVYKHSEKYVYKFETNRTPHLLIVRNCVLLCFVSATKTLLKRPSTVIKARCCTALYWAAECLLFHANEFVSTMVCRIIICAKYNQNLSTNTKISPHRSTVDRKFRDVFFIIFFHWYDNHQLPTNMMW